MQHAPSPAGAVRLSMSDNILHLYGDGEARPNSGHARVLTELSHRAAAALNNSEAAQDYLRSVDVPNPDVWESFRLGTSSPNLTGGIGTSDWAMMTELGLIHPVRGTASLDDDGGILIPTCDPRHREDVLGLVRIAFCQHRHRFITPPQGIACDADFMSAPRIILTENALLGLRLARMGVTGIGGIEDPTVLPPLKDVLAEREVVVVGYYQRGRAALIEQLRTVSITATEAALHPTLANSTSATLEVLGLDRETLRGKERPDITPQVLRDVHEYAMGRIAAGCAAEALRQFDLENSSVIGLYQIGYLPSDFGRALSPVQRRMLEGRLSGNALIVPARDERGIIVDVMSVPCGPGRSPNPTLHRAPSGLIAPAVTTSFDDIVLVDTLRAAADLMTAGKRHVVLLRGLKDAQANAKRIAANGVRRAIVHCKKNASEITECLRAAGIAVAGGGVAAPEPEPVQMLPVAAPTVPEPVPLPPITSDHRGPVPAEVALIHHDRRQEQATFGAGDLRYVAEVPWGDEARIGIRISRGGKEHPDRLDLAEAVQRRRCATSAALRVGASAATIESHLSNIHLAMQSLVEREADAPPSNAATLAEIERREALVLARAPDLFDRLVDGLGELGWVGEESAKKFALLAAFSRKLSDPLWLAFSCGAGDDAPGIEAIAAITPPEDCIHVSRLTESAFAHAEASALRQKLLIIDDLARLSAGVSTALRILKRRGALSSSRVERDELRGEMRTTFVEVKGPIALLAVSSGPVDAVLQSYVIGFADEASPEQVERLIAARRQHLSHGGTGHDQRAKTIARLRDLQRIIEPLPVVMPFAQRIDGFGMSPRARRDQETLLSLIGAHALLHQHQRTRADGAVIATSADFEVAAALMNDRLAAEDAGLGRQAQALLRAIWSAGLSSFTMDDCAAMFPDWTRYAFRAGIDELIALDYITSPRGGRGAKRTYHLHAGSAAPAAIRRITLRPVGELATVGEPPDIAANDIHNTA